MLPHRNPYSLAASHRLRTNHTPQVNEGIILAVGPGRRNKDGELLPLGVKEGDKVLLPEYGGSMVKMDQKE